MAAQNVNPSPKEQFLKNSNLVGAHREMIQSEAFSQSEKFALLQFARDLSKKATADPSVAAANHFALIGAHQFLDVFRNLGEVSAPTTRKDLDNLPGN